MTTRFVNEIQVFLSGKRKSEASPAPAFLKFRSSTVFIVVTVCLAVFTDILYYGLVVPVIPFSLTVQIGVPEDQVQQWTAILLACYNAALFVGAPIAGVYADHTSSRRLPLLFGLLALGASTLLLCLGKSMALLILGRLLQGLSASIVWSVGLALLADTMGRNIGYAMGYVSVAMSVGLLISPVIGGAVYAAAGYYAVYYMAFAVVVCDIVLRLVMVEKKVARQWIKDDDGPAVLGAGAGAAPEPDAPSMPDPAGAAQTQVVGENDKEAAALPDQVGPEDPAKAAVDSSPQTAPGEPAKHPKWELIKSKRILGALFGIVIEAGAMLAFDTVIPLFVKDTFHWNSTAAGLVFICVMIPGFLAPLVGLVSDRYGAKLPAALGFAASIPLLVCLRFITEDTLREKVALCALLVLLGTTFTFTNPALMAEISYAIEAKEASHPGLWGEKGVYGIAYGLYTTGFALGGTVGTLMAGYLQAGPGWGATTWALGVWVAVGAVVTSIMVGGKPGKAKAGPGPRNAEGLQTAAAAGSDAA